MRLIPSAFLNGRAATALAADTGGLNQATDALHVHLMKAPFTPNEAVSFSAANEATFTGSAAKLVGTGAQTVYVDPASGERRVLLKEPVGGWTWVCTATPGAAETCHGVIVTLNDDTTVVGSTLLDEPVEISASGQGVSVPSLEVQLPPGFMG